MTKSYIRAFVNCSLCCRYHPGGYLPTQSQPRKQRELSKKEKVKVKKEFKAAPARAELKEKKKEGKRTTAKKEQQVTSII